MILFLLLLFVAIAIVILAVVVARRRSGQSFLADQKHDPAAQSQILSMSTSLPARHQSR